MQASQEGSCLSSAGHPIPKPPPPPAPSHLQHCYEQHTAILLYHLSHSFYFPTPWQQLCLQRVERPVSPHSLPVSLETRPAHQTPTPQSPGQGGLGIRMAEGVGGQQGTHKEATGGLDSRCFGELEGQHSCERGRGRSDGAQGSSRGGPRPTCPPGTPLTTLEHSFDIQSFT